LAELCVAKNAVFAEDMIGLNIFSTKTVAPQRIESSVCRAPGSSLREPILAHAPEAVTRTQPEPFIVKHALHKAGAAELASRLWDLPAAGPGFALLPGVFAR
jgi:hypothetical protein